MKVTTIKGDRDAIIDKCEEIIIGGDPITCPLTHRFTDGMYSREIFVEKMKISFSQESDIEELEKIASKTFVKMELKELGLVYDKETFISNAKGYISGNNFIVLKCEQDNKIIGGLFAYFLPQLYSNKNTIVQEFALQSDPDLCETTQAKVLIRLIKHLEGIAEELESDLIGFSFMEKFDISKYLEKKKYKKSDVIFVRRIK